RAAPTPEDLAWESELVLLLSRLEALRTELGTCCVRGEGVAALETMLAMGACLTGFADHHASVVSEGAVELRQRDEEFAALAPQPRDGLQRTTLKMISGLMGWRSEGGDPHVQFVAAAQALFDLLARAFDRFTDCFGSPAAARAWAEAQSVFLTDLRGL